jgi:esterase/lipase
MMRALLPITAGLTLLLTSCATTGELEPRHAPSGLATPLPQADFAAYVEQAKATIAAAGRELGQELAPEVVEQRAPFELVPDPARCARPAEGRHAQAALLIHGLGGTPYEMRALGVRLAAACYLVRAILLPGHGTVPGDLLDLGAEEWLEATRLGAMSLAGVADEVVLLGFSEGGTLALDYALAEDEEGAAPALGGLVLLAPALAPPGGIAGFARRYFSLGRASSTHSFAQLLPDDEPVRYGSIARNAELQAIALIDRLDQQDQLLELPVFMALTAADAETDPVAARRWFCRHLVGPRRLVWYAEGEQAPGEDCRFVETRAGAAPPAVLDLAHRALPIAPDDPHYGSAGDQLDCGHYYYETDTPNWLLCLDPGKTPANSQIRYGEITQSNLSEHVMRRLTYNPDFDGLAGEILDFLEGLPWPGPPKPTT